MLSMAGAELQARRRAVAQAWSTFMESGATGEVDVRPEILDSWRRARATVPTSLRAAPLADEAETAAYWQDSPVSTAVARVEDEIRRTADDGELLVAVSDLDSRLLWTYATHAMRRRAESVHAVPAGRWDDRVSGTNAITLTARLGKPTTCFASEHFAPVVQDWACWAAPLHDLVTGRQIGVIDLTTTWSRAHPIGLSTARLLARLVEQAMPATQRSSEDSGHPPGLEMHLLGSAAVWLDGRRLALSRRRVETLALLALHPDGLTLEQLHAMLYGDERVTFSTLKAELSRIRQTLGGRLASRPYRLTLPVTTDVERVLALLRRGHVAAAVDLYDGELLPGTNSPALHELSQVVTVAVREALLASPQPSAVVRYADRAPHDVEVVEACLRALGDRPHPAGAVLRGHLAAGPG